MSRYISRERRDREAIILYAGDCDPHGYLIEDDFSRRVFGATIIRVALTRHQANTMGLAGDRCPGRSATRPRIR
jgi:hypothetical protein